MEESTRLVARQEPEMSQSTKSGAGSLRPAATFLLKAIISVASGAARRATSPQCRAALPWGRTENGAWDVV